MRGQWKIVISKSRSSFRNGRVAEAHHCVELCSRWARHGAAAGSQGAETDAVIYAGSPKLDNRRLEKGCLVGSVSMSAVTFRRMGSGFGVTAWKHQSILFSISSSGWWCVCVCVSLAHLRPLTDSWVPFGSVRLEPLSYTWPLLPCTEVTRSWPWDLAPVEHFWDAADWEICVDAQPTKT